MADVSVNMGVSGISQFKQGMNEAQASVKTLDAALKANEKQFERSGNAEEHYAAQTTLLNQKLKQQKEIISNAEKALKQMEDNGVKQTSTAYQNMQRKLIEATSAMMDTQDQLDSLGSKAAGTAEKTQKLSDSLGGLNKRVSLEQVIGAVNSITTGLEKAARKAVDLGRELWNTVMDSARRADDTATMAEMYGIDLDTFQRMQKLVAGGMDTSVEAILTAQDKLKKGIGKDSKEVIGYLEQLGISTRVLSGDEGVGEFVSRDQNELFWEAGQAIMAMGDAFDKEAAAQALFGKSWKELVPLFNSFKTLEEYNAALAEQTVNDEETIRDLAALNDAVGKLESSWTTLKDEMLGAIAPALTKGAEAISGLLDSLMQYLQTEDGQKLLEGMGKAVEGLFKDITEIDPQEVINSFSGVFDKITGGLQWIQENSGTVVGALGAIVGGWAALKLTGGALEILKLIQGLQGLTSGAGAAAKASGAAAGTAWASGFSGAVATAAPWLATMLGITAAAVTPAVLAQKADEERWKSKQQEREAAAEAAKQAASENYDFILDAAGAVGPKKNADGSYQKDATGLFLNMNPTDETTALLMGLQDRQNQQKAELANIIRQYAAPTAGNDTWNLLNAFWGGAELDPVVVNEMLQNITDAMATDAQNKVKVPAELEAPENQAEILAAETGVVNVPANLVIGGMDFGGLTTGGMPKGGGGGRPAHYTKGHANGLWSVPFDGYAAILHKGERVVPAREAGSSRNYNSNLYVESMIMNNGQDAEGLAAAMAAAQRRTSAGFGS